MSAYEYASCCYKEAIIDPYSTQFFLLTMEDATGYVIIDLENSKHYKQSQHTTNAYTYQHFKILSRSAAVTEYISGILTYPADGSTFQNMAIAVHSPNLDYTGAQLATTDIQLL